jgi:hypothetical protein
MNRKFSSLSLFQFLISRDTLVRFQWQQENTWFCRPSLVMNIFSFLVPPTRADASHIHASHVLEEPQELTVYSRKPSATKNVSFDQAGDDDVERMIAMLESQNQRSVCLSHLLVCARSIQ